MYLNMDHYKRSGPNRSSTPGSPPFRKYATTLEYGYIKKKEYDTNRPSTKRLTHTLIARILYDSRRMRPNHIWAISI